MKPIIQNRKIKIAIVGCGRISKNHFEAVLSQSKDFELIGVCDTNPESLAQAKQKYNVPGYSELTEMLKKCDADIYSLCTPSGLHPRQAIEISRAGKNVLSEKPMSVRYNEGVEMVQECKKNNVHLFVVKQNRLNPTIQKIKKAIDSNRFGKLYMITCNVFWTRPQDYYDQAKWRGTWELDGGAYMNQASHYVDLLCWFFGPIEHLYAETGTLARKIETEDTGSVVFRWKNGAIGSMNVTMLTYPKNLEGSITILGDRGTVKVGGQAVNEILEWHFQEKLPEDENITGANYQIKSVYGPGHTIYYQNVAATLRGEAKASVDGDEGLKSLEVLCAIYESAKHNKKVSLK